MQLRFLAKSMSIAVGLGASTVLLVDYLDDAASLCTIGGGCDEVKSYALASIAGLPTPVFGVFFFGAMLAASLFARPQAKVIWIASAVGAVLAAALLVVQGLVIGAFCKYCVLADAAAIVLFLSLHAERGKPAESLAVRMSSCGLVLASVAGFYVAALSGSTVTGRSAETAAATQTDGVATVVEFIDFQCPGCRQLHKRLSRAMEPHEGKVRVVRKHLPIPRHTHARDAAQAYCCAERAGKADEMADRLFTAPDLTPEACRQVAMDIGISEESYDDCLKSGEPIETIAVHRAEAVSLDIKVLPTLFVGATRFDGAPDQDTLVASIERAIATAAQN
jgi:uncharacterized membrane protein/predicted DsbA family dithiol-disulfide isomerase